MKKISILTTLLLAFMSNFVIAQIDDYAVSAIPETLKKDAHTVIRYEKTTFEVSSLNKGEIRYKGIITLMDKRLVTKRYGKQLLDSLPPYQIISKG